MATTSISFEMFDQAAEADFGPAPIREVWGQVFCSEDGFPVIKQIQTKYYVWVKNVHNGHSFAWSVSALEAKRLQATVIKDDGLRFRVFETDKTYIDQEGVERRSTAQEISNLKTGEIIWKLPDNK